MRFSSLPLVLLAVACSAPRKAEQPLTMEEQIVQEILPIVNMQPDLWETTGSELQPVLQLGGPAVRDFDFEFQYEGPGTVTTPGTVRIAKGDSQAALEGFACGSTNEAAEGVVHVSVLTVEGDLVLVADWPVLQRPSIISGLTTMATEVVQEDDMFACLVAVELDQLEESFGREFVPERDLQFEAWVEEQGAYKPRVRVTQDVGRDDFPNLTRDFEFEGNRLIVLVCVERSKVPPRGRAYVTLRATIAGDTAKKNVALPIR